MIAKETQEAFNRALGRSEMYLDLDILIDMSNKAAESGEITNKELYKRNSPGEFGLLKNILSICTQLVGAHLLRYKNSPRVHISFLINNKLGAVAAKDKESGDYFIGLYIGSVWVLRAFFSAMLCSPKVLTWVGDVSVEEVSKLDNPFMINTETLMEFLNANPDQRLVPNDPVRWDAAQILTSYAMQFLALHELGHIVRGHVDYYNLLAEESPIHKLLADSGAQVLPNVDQLGLKLQAMEWDADYFATFHGALASYQVHNVPLSTEENKEVLELWLFAIYSTFRLLSLFPYNANVLASRSHPPAGIRMNMVLNVAGEQIDRLAINFFGREANKEEITELLHTCMRTVETGLQDICDDNELLKLGATNLTYAALEEAHIAKIESACNNIWPDIERFKLEFINPTQDWYWLTLKPNS